MDPVTLAIMAASAGIKGLIGAGKAIVGGIQKRRAEKELDKEFPKYTRPEEYSKLLSIYQQQAGLGQLPGQDRYESALSTRTARGVRATGKLADSSVASVQAAMGLYGQEQQAVRDLGLSYADYQQQSQRNLAGAYQQGAQYSDKEFSYNQWYPDQVRRNMAAQKWNAGNQNLWGGIDMFAGAATDFAGNYLSAQNGMGGGNSGGGTNPTQTAALQGNANAALTIPSLYSNLAKSSVGQQTASGMTLFNPYATTRDTFLPSFLKNNG